MAAKAQKLFTHFNMQNNDFVSKTLNSKGSLARYHKFMILQCMFPQIPLHMTSEVFWAWYSHVTRPAKYHSYCQYLIKTFVQHLPTQQLRDECMRIHESRHNVINCSWYLSISELALVEDCFTFTQKLWQSVFNEPYIPAQCQQVSSSDITASYLNGGYKFSAHDSSIYKGLTMSYQYALAANAQDADELEEQMMNGDMSLDDMMAALEAQMTGVATLLQSIGDAELTDELVSDILKLKPEDLDNDLQFFARLSNEMGIQNGRKWPEFKDFKAWAKNYERYLYFAQKH